MTKRLGIFLASLVLIAATGAGCMERLAEELIDVAGAPDQIYHSGNDLLSGSYNVIGRPGTKYDKDEPVVLRGDEKGWKMSNDGTAGLHIYEFPPAEAQKMFQNYNQSTMQCAGTMKVMDFKICTAPKGTRIRHGSIDQTMDTGYIVLFDKDWNHAQRK